MRPRCPGVRGRRLTLLAERSGRSWRITLRIASPVRSWASREAARAVNAIVRWVGLHCCVVSRRWRSRRQSRTTTALLTTRLNPTRTSSAHMGGSMSGPIHAQASAPVTAASQPHRVTASRHLATSRSATDMMQRPSGAGWEADRPHGQLQAKGVGRSLEGRAEVLGITRCGCCRWPEREKVPEPVWLQRAPGSGDLDRCPGRS